MTILKCNGKLRWASLVPLFVTFVGTLNLVLSSPLRNSRLHYDTVPQNLPDKLFDNRVSGYFTSDDSFYEVGYPTGLLQGPTRTRPQLGKVNKRRKRDLKRSTRKISSMPTQMQMPAYYPFIMAEMLPGAVKTRHPSIIAVSGCPAYYIADHRGRCRQVFQYTVNFGQRHNSNPAKQEAPNPFLINRFANRIDSSHNPFAANRRAGNPFLTGGRPSFSSQSFVGGVSRFRNFFRTTPTPTTAAPPTTTSQIPPHKYSNTPSPSLVALFRKAAKKFDLTFLAKKIISSSSNNNNNSGESNDFKEINELRGQILKALKIARPRNHSRPTSTPETIQTTTEDYDD